MIWQKCETVPNTIDWLGSVTISKRDIRISSPVSFNVRRSAGILLYERDVCAVHTLRKCATAIADVVPQTSHSALSWLV